MSPADRDLDAAVLPVLPIVGALIVGRYRLTAALDEGGMGCVFRAQDTRLGRPCAVKFLRPELALKPELRTRFEREARVAGQLQAENVVAVTDCGEHDGLPFIVMELLLGEDLGSLLAREQRLPLPRAVDFVVQVCRGLQAVHREGIVHRDIKPGNLFITRHSDGRDLLKVIDFGVVKWEGDRESNSATRSGAIIGTIQYMPPEQVRGEAIDARADVYALGAVLYQALAGQPPIQSGATHALIHRILSGTITPLRTLRPGLPEAVYGVVERALQRDPAARHASANAFGRELERASGWQAGSGATHVSAPPSIALVSPEASHGLAPAPAPAPAPSRLTFGRLGAVLLWVVLVTAAWWLARPTHPLKTNDAQPVRAASPQPSPPKFARPLPPASTPSGAVTPRASKVKKPARDELDLGEVFPK